jgi:hypothetical protein
MDAIPSGLRLMWDGWEKKWRFASLWFCHCDYDLNVFHRPTNSILPTCIITTYHQRSVLVPQRACLSQTEQFQQVILLIPIFVSHPLFISCPHTLYIHHYSPPESIHSLATCSLSYPSFVRFLLSFYAIVFCHCAKSYIRTWPAFFRYASRP